MAETTTTDTAALTTTDVGTLSTTQIAALGATDAAALEGPTPGSVMESVLSRLAGLESGAEAHAQQVSEIGKLFTTLNDDFIAIRDMLDEAEGDSTLPERFATIEKALSALAPLSPEDQQLLRDVTATAADLKTALPEIMSVAEKVKTLELKLKHFF